MSNDKLIKGNNVGFDVVKSLDIANKVLESLSNSQLLDKYKYTNPETKKVEIRTGDAISAIVMGANLGLDPITSLNAGNDLKGSSVFAIDKGISLGLTPLEAIKMVHSIPTKNGISLHTSIHVIAKKIIESGTKLTLVDDYAPVYSYLVKPVGSKDYVPIEANRVLGEDGKILEKFCLIDATITEEEIAKAKELKQMGLKRYISDYVTTWKFDRPSTKTELTMSYYRSEAVKAGLIESRDKQGNIINSGKANWNNAERQMMRNRPLATGGRIIIADLLNGIYDIESETEHVIDKDIHDLNDQEARIVE